VRRWVRHWEAGLAMAYDAALARRPRPAARGPPRGGFEDGGRADWPHMVVWRRPAEAAGPGPMV
jgi:hypothetical protein